MKKRQIAKRVSLLSIVLMAISAVMATVIPRKSSEVNLDNSLDNATLRSISGIGGDPWHGGLLSCVPDDTYNFSCHRSSGSQTITTAFSAGLVSDGILYHTISNTSHSIYGNGIDTTSEF